MVASERVSYQSFSSQRHVGSIAGLEREGYEEFNINALQCNASLGGGFWKVFRAVNSILATQQVLSGGGGGIWEVLHQCNATWSHLTCWQCWRMRRAECSTMQRSTMQSPRMHCKEGGNNTVQRNELLKFQKNWLHFNPTMHFNSGKFIAMLTVLAIPCKH